MEDIGPSNTRIHPIVIVHVLHSFEVGGLENGVVNLINGLDWQKYRHVICCLTRAGGLVDRLVRKDIEIIELGKVPGHSWTYPVRLARQFRKIMPQIVHTRNWGTIDGILGARLSCVPVVVHGEHGRTMADANGNNPKRRIVRKGLTHFVDRFVTVSRELREWLHRCVGVDGRKIETICNGVDLDRFARRPDRLAARAELGIRPDHFVIGTVGRLDPIKDQAALIRALAGLVPQYPQVRLLIVGNGPCFGDLDRLRNQLRVADRVSLMGERSDVAELLQLFDIFALPSLFEGISNTILEAMASGLPVVATDVGGNSELVQDQNTGRLIPAQDLPALESSLRAYVEDSGLVVQHGQAGRQRAERQFSVTKMIREYDRMYSNLFYRHV